MIFEFQHLVHIFFFLFCNQSQTHILIKGWSLRAVRCLPICHWCSRITDSWWGSSLKIQTTRKSGVVLCYVGKTVRSEMVRTYIQCFLNVRGYVPIINKIHPLSPQNLRRGSVEKTSVLFCAANNRAAMVVSSFRHGSNRSNAREVSFRRV